MQSLLNEALPENRCIQPSGAYTGRIYKTMDFIKRSIFGLNGD